MNEGQLEPWRLCLVRTDHGIENPFQESEKLPQTARLLSGGILGILSRTEQGRSPRGTGTTREHG